MIRTIIICFLFTTILSCQNTDAEKEPVSPLESAMATIGNAKVQIDYSSPAVRGRTIFGHVVPYEEIWRAGDNKATTISIDKNIEIDNKVFPKGKYAIFMIPNKDKWMLILNRNWNQNGTEKYNVKENVLQVIVDPIFLDDLQEQLEYKVEQVDNNNGIISMAWEKTKVELPFKIF